MQPERNKAGLCAARLPEKRTQTITTNHLNFKRKDKNERIISLSILLTVFLTAFAQGRFKEIEKCFNEPASQSILIVSHRADWRNAPENSLQAIQNCIDMGADMVEIDLKKTKNDASDFSMIKTINRTMTGTGSPDEYTLAELKAMRLRNGAGLNPASGTDF